MKPSYKIEPADPSTISSHDDKGEGPYYSTIGSISALFTFIFLIGIWLLVIFFIANIIFGGNSWIWLLIIVIVSYGINQILLRFTYHLPYDFRKKVALRQAEEGSKKLNQLLDKSREIVDEILPHFKTAAEKSLKDAKIDLSDNAIYPFWEKIESITNYLGFYKEALDQLVFNGELYSNLLSGKHHNFPTPFPINTKDLISQVILDDYNSIVRKAHTKPDFANIFGHIKTQKILVAGFYTLSEAINNMSNAVESAINGLKHSIKSDFRELRNIQIEQLRNFEISQETINNTLDSMDRKLYYLQYHKKPTTPFVRPFND